jgi:hypothetical protein
MGQTGMYTFGGPGGRSMGDFRDAEQFGISMAETDGDAIAGFDRERYRQLKEERKNLDIRDFRDKYSTEVDEDAIHGTVSEATFKYHQKKRELDEEIDKFKPKRERANRIRSGWQDALSEAGDVDLDMPRQLRMATGSNLLNVSKMRANMQRDTANIQNAAMTAADNAFFSSQQQIRAADTLGDMADAQRRAETTQNIIGGIAGAGLLIGGTLLTGGAFGAAQGLTAGRLGMMGSGLTQFGSSFM